MSHLKPLQLLLLLLLLRGRVKLLPGGVRSLSNSNVVKSNVWRSPSKLFVAAIR